MVLAIVATDTQAGHTLFTTGNLKAAIMVFGILI